MSRAHVTPAACTGLLGWLLGHGYVPRYSTIEQFPPPEFWGARPGTYDCTVPADAVMPGSRTYHGDVCTRCGDVVNRQEGA